MVKEQLQRLWRLQALERTIAEAQKVQDSSPLELERLQGILKSLEDKKEEGKRRIDELEKDRRMREGELELESEKVKHSQLRLLEIKTNKEYQAFLKEIDRAKELNSQTEEEIIGILDEIDQSKSDYASFLERAQRERTEIEEEIDTVTKRMAQTEKDIALWHTMSDEIIKEVAPELLKRYATIKGKRDGVAIVLVKNEACQGCYVNIPPQLYNEVQKSIEIILCPNCNRILYWEAD